MPVHRTTSNGHAAYQWGQSGKKYTYTVGNEASRKRAKQKAHLQGAAVEKSGGK